MEFKPVVFYIGEEQYGIDINIVRGIEKTMQVVPMPNANPIIKGIINLRGDVVPICSLRRKFNKPDKEYDDDTKFIIVKTDTLLLGLEVDAVGDIQNIEEKDIFDVPKIVVTDTTQYYSNVINKNGKLIVMLDINKLMSDSEMKVLEETIQSL